MMTPIAFSISNSLAKHLSQERIGFDSNTLVFTSQILINSVIVAIGIAYWNYHGHSHRHVMLGLSSGITEAIGKALIQYAITFGEAGPACAISSMEAVYLAIWEAVMFKRWLVHIEIIAIIFCMLGAIEVVIPQQMEKLFCMCRR